MNTEQFYMVWNPNRGTPRVKHATHAEAKAEAERLAAKQPGDTFYILRSRNAVTVEKKPDLNAAHRLMLAASAEQGSASAAYDSARKVLVAAQKRLYDANCALDEATVAFVKAGQAV